ncbi:Multidrug resistance protein stp [Streptomyces sp. S4.7]|uniref:DHA2 family efflux MFS transporter permease subunit n=1 Tax=Streptomyces sp. S4.7 TaxID=2705439 RepID=UPI001398D668|nr:DHA2 family efflux MFS transporter permease subunit [Streptomyces sp. S4.7]QHY99219.1 Multidrug resistance protein stp [Streptomyces sp. S4.7]
MRADQDEHHKAADSGRTPRSHPGLILTVLCLAYFKAQLDGVILPVALPRITDDLNADLQQTAWVMSAYVFTLAVALISAGRLGDLYGKRRTLLIGVTMFTLCSVAGGLAQSPEQLIAARGLQGLGAALIIPQSMALLVETYPAERRGMALGIRGGVGGAAAVAGPVLGGLLVSLADWRWIFFLNLPIGVAILVLAWIAIPVTAPRPRRLDLGGVALSSGALLALAVGLNQGESAGWSGWIWWTLAGAAGLGVLFCLQQRRRQDREPLVPVSIFRDWNYTVMNVYAVLAAVLMVGLVLTLSVYFQSVLEFSALRTGLLLMPASLFSMLLSPVAGKLSDKVEGRYLLLAGALVISVGMLWVLVGMDRNASWQDFAAAMCCIGMGNALLLTPLSAVALYRVTPESAGAASGVLATSMQIGVMVGAAVVGGMLGGRGATVLDAGRLILTALVFIAVLAGGLCLMVRRVLPAPDSKTLADRRPG